MTYNIRHGVGLDEVLDLTRAGKLLQTQNPDLCGLQEVDNNCERSGNKDQIELLATYTSQTPTFGEFMPYQGGAYGMGTLISLPIISSKNLSLPPALYEPRSAIVHEVGVASQCTVSFANVHFDWVNSEEGEANRLKQAKSLVKYLDSLNRPAIIVGDFNCRPSSSTMQYFIEQNFQLVDKGDDKMSFQGQEKAEIDHVIFRDGNNVNFKVKSQELLNEPITSDHRPFIVLLEVEY